MSVIATTHVGSLPRGPELAPLLIAKDHGEAYDTELFETVVQSAIEDAVAKQVEAGVTIVSDGELGKVGYSTYVIERLEGLEAIASASPRWISHLCPSCARSLLPSWATRNLPARPALRPSSFARWSLATKISGGSTRR